MQFSWTRFLFYVMSSTMLAVTFVVTSFAAFNRSDWFLLGLPVVALLVAAMINGFLETEHES